MLKQGSRMLTEGYYIVLHPAMEVQRYNTDFLIRSLDEESLQYLKTIRDAFSHLDPAYYRGISRYPLKPYYQLCREDMDRYRRKGIDFESNKKAAVRLKEIVPPIPYEDSNESLIPTKKYALEIFNLLDNPREWEIIHVRREEFRPNPKTLGFDVGYWGGDHFSLIADTALLPHWHPPIPEDFHELTRELSELNSNLLFTDPDSAIRFRQFYKSKPWAETDATGNEFHIIQVDAVIPAK
jgi:hypothetical protein